MKPTDLRLNNIITDENDFEMYVVGIGEDYITADFEGNEGDVWEFDFKHSFPKPIELTEEILLKCGDIKWLLSDREGYYVLINNKKIRINFVHSLQNIYLYIEQKELNLCL